MTAGRPTDYTSELGNIICARLMKGESLRQLCRDKAMPHRSTVHLWILTHKTFSDQYTLAKEVQADEMFDEILEIADDSQGDVIADEYGNTKQNHEFVQRSKLRIDARKWMLARMAPKKYGEKAESTLALQSVSDTEIKISFVKPGEAKQDDSN